MIWLDLFWSVWARNPSQTVGQSATKVGIELLGQQKIEQIKTSIFFEPKKVVFWICPDMEL